MVDGRSLNTQRHAVYRLGPDLLLVFKPRGHREAEHGHAHGQRLSVIRGRLEIRTSARVTRLGPRSRPLRLAAGRRHATRALSDTWLIVESLGGTMPRRTAPRR